MDFLDTLTFPETGFHWFVTFQIKIRKTPLIIELRRLAMCDAVSLRSRNTFLCGKSAIGIASSDPRVFNARINSDTLHERE